MVEKSLVKDRKMFSSCCIQLILSQALRMERIQREKKRLIKEGKWPPKKED